MKIRLNKYPYILDNTIAYNQQYKFLSNINIINSRVSFNLMNFCLQMILKNLTDNAKNLATNAKIEDVSRLIKNHMAGKQDVKNALSGVMVRITMTQTEIYNFLMVFLTQ